jgi:hypothetical protein
MALGKSPRRSTNRRLRRSPDASPRPSGDCAARRGWRCWLGPWERWAAWLPPTSRGHTEAPGGGRGAWLRTCVHRGSCARRCSPFLERCRPRRWLRVRRRSRARTSHGLGGATRSRLLISPRGDRIPTHPRIHTPRSTSGRETCSLRNRPGYGCSAAGALRSSLTIPSAPQRAQAWPQTPPRARPRRNRRRETPSSDSSAERWPRLLYTRR